MLFNQGNLVSTKMLLSKRALYPLIGCTALALKRNGVGP